MIHGSPLPKTQPRPFKISPAWLQKCRDQMYRDVLVSETPEKIIDRRLMHYSGGCITKT